MSRSCIDACAARSSAGASVTPRMTTSKVPTRWNTRSLPNSAKATTIHALVAHTDHGVQ